MSVQRVFKYVAEARPVFKALNSVFLIYKPAHLRFNRMRDTIIQNLCRDLNDMKTRPPLKYVVIEGQTDINLKVHVRDSFADHPLVVGPRYQPNDFRLAATKNMHEDVSGIIVCGLNKGNRIVHMLKESKCVRFYRVAGLLGQATDNYFHTGKIVEKSKYTHVKRGHIDKICTSMQSSHQRKMFDLCGVDIQSQAAYELALQGPLRPTDRSIPLLYTIKCVDFSPPHFALEIVCTQEYDMYLKTIVHDLGMALRTNATCVQIQCIQDGLFNKKHALLTKHWTLEHIMDNMQMCRAIIDQNPKVLRQENPALVEYDGDTKVRPTIYE
ncbi:putative tRNA pseudouridine synthase 2 [Habropoda laboriosa]|uniref:Putative tRNA pseudouridine synthase 2 n=1 Tax=Habropoda laboriosa TaxID=597456 RepID=A0A0L7R597_9HYME|nr:PREDICTED: probable tRNA pseudouridine synthase 2 [Habropoda laboriosa]KOC66052.1 putative tRNA pseudouridine synthase 2 [Habropoda laboriosa]